MSLEIVYNALRYLILVVITVTTTLAGVSYYNQSPVIEPYTDAHIYRQVKTDRGIELTSTFVKNDRCRLTSFRVLGAIDTLTEYIDYEDLDGIGNDFDREPGKQTLRILIPVDPAMDTIVLRTSHDCDTMVENEKTGEEEKRTTTIRRVYAKLDPDVNIYPPGEEANREAL